MAEVTITVNGRALRAQGGELLIDVCRREGIDIPSFCSYPGLSPQGACRMCLVKIEKMPKLQTSCTTQITDGMIVETETVEVVQARKAMLEILLANHPLDCPVCDAGGECELQDMTYACGAGESKFVEIKSHREEQQWSPAVFYDRPRCILCYRCVRVCGEAMDVWALGVENRGQGSVIAPNAGDRLDCEQCGMCIDICPVGALTSGSYRYKTRPWEMMHTATVCAHCSDGCRVTLGSREGEEGREIIRADNRDRGGLNGEFLCNKGRFGFDFVTNEKRITEPQIRHGEILERANWSEALNAVADKFMEIRSVHGADAIGVIGSNMLTNEENYLLQKFTRLVLGTNNIDHRRTADYPSFVRAIAEHKAREASIAEAATAPAILLIGNDPTTRHPQLAWHLRNNVRLHKARLYVVNANEIKLARQAALSAIIPATSEAAFVDYLSGNDAATQLLKNSRLTEAQLSAMRENLRGEKDLLIVFGAEIYGDTMDALIGWGATIGAGFLCLSDFANSRGAADMGVLPKLLPGYTSLKQSARFRGEWGFVPETPGLTMQEMLEAVVAGSVKALYLADAEPLERETLCKLKQSGVFLVSQSGIQTAIHEFADVTLPSAMPYEKEGSMTNASGDLQRLKASSSARGKSAIEILVRLAVAMGFDRERLHAPAPVKRLVTAQLRGPHSGEADRHEVWLESNRVEAETVSFDPAAILDEIQQQVPGYFFSRGELLLNGVTRTTLAPLAPQEIPVEGHLLQPLPQGLFGSAEILASSMTGELQRHQESFTNIKTSAV